MNYGDGATTGYYAVAQWAALTTYDCGALRRQLAAPAVGSERVFVVVAGHVASGAAEPTWVITRGGKTTDATITWQECTGIAAINGDLSTNTPTWTIVKNTAVTLGQVIQNVAGTLILICTTAGTAGNGAEPTWAAYTTAGATTADNTVTWTTLGASFAGWSAPHARQANAFTATWGQAGNSFFFASESVETQSASMTLTSPGTAANPCFIYCVTKTTVPPVSANLTTGGSIAVSTTTNAMTLAGTGYYRGITFTYPAGGGGAGIVLANLVGEIELDTCKLVANGAQANVGIYIGGTTTVASRVFLTNTTVKFGATTQSFIMRIASLEWRNTASAVDGAGSIPATLFIDGTTVPGSLICIGVDLSALGSGKTVFGASLFTTSTFIARLIDCGLGASVTLSSTPAARGVYVDAVRCDSAAANTRDERYWYEGTQTVDTTIVRTGGATDGTTVIAWKLVSTANSKWVFPFESQPITIWNDSTSAITTLTIYGTTTGGGVPKDDEIWVEVEYLGSSATPQGSFITSSKADNLAASAATNNSADGSTWGGGGAGNGFKIVVPSFTPGMKGPINITIKVAKASSTYYIDPKPSISGVTVSKSEILAPGVYANELSSGSGSGAGFSLIATGGGGLIAA